MGSSLSLTGTLADITRKGPFRPADMERRFSFSPDEFSALVESALSNIGPDRLSSFMTVSPPEQSTGSVVPAQFNPADLGLRVSGSGMVQPVQSFQDRISGFRDIFGGAPEIATPESLAESFERFRPKAVSGLGQGFFESQREGLKEALRQEFFGQGGRFDEGLSKESAAGRLGSGVARNILQRTVTEPFINASSQIDRDILQAQTAEQARVDDLNTKLQSDFNNTLASLRQRDSQNYLLAQQANAELRATYDELFSRLAQAQSEEDISFIEAEIAAQEQATRQYEAESQALARERAAAIDAIGIPYPAGGGLLSEEEFRDVFGT